MTKTEIYKQTFDKEKDCPGLEAIQIKEKEVYGNQEPVHLATIVPYELGGEDPLWAVEYFKSSKRKNHFHHITLGFTNLWYDEDWAESEVNGFGFELTLRHLPVEGDPERPIWPANFLQNIAKYVFKTGKVFDEYHYMSANGPIRDETATAITAMVFLKDPEMNEINTPHGFVKFIQIFGITSNEYTDLKEKKYSVKELLDKHRITNPLFITDLDRK